MATVPERPGCHTQARSLDKLMERIREDTQMSAAQRGNKRLTAVPDLAWALINSGAFLFNH